MTVKNSHGVSSRNNPNKTRKTKKRAAAKKVMLAAKKVGTKKRK